MDRTIFRSGMRQGLYVVFAAMSLLHGVCEADTQTVPAQITYRIEEGVYVDVGSDKGLKRGVKGQLVLDDGSSVPFEVMQSAHSTALLRLDGQGTTLDADGQALRVDLVFESEEVSAAEADANAEGANAEKAAPEAFVPLLEQMKEMPAVTQSENVSHGNIGVRYTMQTGTDNQLDRSTTRLYTSGNIDRLEGTGWSFKWSGSGRYRSGDAYKDHPDYQTVEPLVYNLMLQHPLVDGGFVRLGRFLPFELPGVGYIDGGQLEVATEGPWRFGLVTGLKPDLVNLELSADEPTIAGYTTLEAGTRGSAYYSGTAGLLASAYKGEANRLALLLDQKASLGPRLDLLSTAQFDFGIADTTNSTSQLSRLDLSVSSRINRDHTLRAGLDHWERVDTPSERDRLAVVDDSLFDNGYWRYWVGARHRLPLKLNLNEEVSFITSDATDDAMRWRVGLTRTGFFAWSSANVSATAYNLESQGASGYGGLLSAYLPFWSGRWSLRPSASMRWMDPDNGGRGLEVSYYSLYLDARIYKQWLLTGGATQTMGEGADATSFDAGLRYSW